MSQQVQSAVSMGSPENKFQEEIKYWKEKCLAIEDRVDKYIQAENFQQSIKDELQVVKNAMTDIESKWCGWFQSLAEKQMESDQYSCKNSILIGGYKSLPKIYGLDFIKATVEELNLLFPSLNGAITPYNIDDAHPLPTKGSSNKKVVIVKFTNRWIKNEIIKHKDDLIGTGLSVSEHLTPHTRELLSCAKNIVGTYNAWVFNTKVFAEHNGMKYHIHNSRDLDLLSEMVKSDHPTSTPQSNEGLETSSNTPENETHSNHMNTTQTSNNTCDSNPMQPPQSQYRNTYEQNYPTLYETLLYNKNKTNSSTLRGKPSRNGRGRGSYRQRGRMNNYN